MLTFIYFDPCFFRVICEDGSGRSVSDFLCRNNIFLFLHALASPQHFKFEQDLLFDPEDLYLCRDISKVFRLLSELSHHEKVLKTGVAGFPKKEKQLHKRLKSERGMLPFDEIFLALKKISSNGRIFF